MKRLLSTVFLSGLLSVATVRSDVLVDFNFAGAVGNESDVAPATIDPSVTLDSSGYLNRGAGMKATIDLWSASGFSGRNGPTSATTITNSISRNVYATFRFTVNSGYEVSLSGISFGWCRQNDKIRNFAVLASLDDGVTGFTTADVIDTVTVTTGAKPPATASSLNLSGDARLQNIPAGTTVILRIYHYGTSNQYDANAFSSMSSLPGLDLVGTASIALGEQPVCTLTAPASGTLYPYGSWPSAIPLTVTAVDDVAVVEVKYYESGRYLGSSTEDPFSFDWNWSPQQGSNYYLVAHAWDGSGNIGTSQTVRVETGIDQPPTVSLTAPLDGTYYAKGSYPTDVTITAATTDDSGIAHVTFYANGSVIGVDDAAPYTMDWHWPATEGFYTLTAVAEDNGGHAVASRRFVIEALGETPYGLLAYDDFSRADPGALHGVASGLGWAASWNIQGGDTSIPGYNVATNVPLTYNKLVSSANYATGGKQYLGCKRRLNVTADGPFASYLTAGDIGAPGTDMWAAYLCRREGTASQPCMLSFGRNSDSNDPTVTRSCWTSNVGGLWAVTHATNNSIAAATASSGKACVGEETALLVLHFEFGVDSSISNHVVSLYVNPPSGGLGSEPPATPDAVLNIVGDGNFHFDGIGFYPGEQPGAGSIDELRIGTTYAVVTPSSAVRQTLIIVR